MAFKRSAVRSRLSPPGRLAQLVAHPLDVREVTSSSLVSSTKKTATHRVVVFCYKGPSRTCDLESSPHSGWKSSECRTRSGLHSQVRVLYHPPRRGCIKRKTRRKRIITAGAVSKQEISASQKKCKITAAGSVQESAVGI